MLASAIRSSSPPISSKGARSGLDQLIGILLMTPSHQILPGVGTIYWSYIASACPSGTVWAKRVRKNLRDIVSAFFQLPQSKNTGSVETIACGPSATPGVGAGSIATPATPRP